MTKKKLVAEEPGLTEPREWTAFIGFRKELKTGEISGFILHPERQKAEEYVGGADVDLPAAPETEVQLEESKEDNLSPMASLCGDLTEKFNNGLSPFHQLIAITGMIRGGMERAAIKNRILGESKARGDRLFHDENGEVYGLSADVHEQISKEITQMREMDEGFALLPSSVLLSLVATFDSIMGDSIKAILSLKPDRLQNSDKTISYRDLFQIGDLGKAQEKFIESEVEKLLRASHEEQIAYIEKIIDTKIIGHYSRWPNFVEVFERRNRIAHAAGIVNADYIEKCKKIGYSTEGIELGSQLDLAPKYLHKAVDILVEFGVTMAFVTWRKLAPESEDDAFGNMNEIAYDLIKQRRYQLAAWLLDFALHKQARGAKDITIRRMFVNLANAYMKMKKEDRALSVLEELDWSASAGPFKVAIASLKKDTAAVCQMLPVLAAAGEITKDQFRQWPVFDWVRKDEEVAMAFEKAFGEPVRLERVESGSVDETLGQPEADSTVH